MGKIFIIKGLTYAPPSTGDGESCGSVLVNGCLQPYFIYYFCQSNAMNYLTYEEVPVKQQINRIKAIYDLTGYDVAQLSIDMAQFGSRSFLIRCLNRVIDRTTAVKNGTFEEEGTLLNYNNGSWTNCSNEKLILTLPEGTKSIMFSIAGPNGGSSVFMNETQLAEIARLFGTTVQLT